MSFRFRPQAAFHRKAQQRRQIKDGSFVLIDVESRSFICFNLRIFYKLLLRVRITFHSVNQSHTHSFTFIELQLEFVATLQQSIEFLRVQLCGRKSKYVKTSIYVSIAARFNSQLGRRVASFRRPVIADFECFLRVGCVWAGVVKLESHWCPCSIAIWRPWCAPASHRSISGIFGLPRPTLWGYASAVADERLARELLEIRIVYLVAVDFAELVVDAVNFLLVVGFLDNPPFCNVPVDGLLDGLLCIILSNSLVDIIESDRAVLVAH